MIYRTLILCLLLSACNPSTKPSWYVSQGLTLSGCGHATSAMAERIVRGNNITRSEVRRFSPQGINFAGWWNLQLISNYLNSVGVPNQYTRIENVLLRGIYHVDGNHFVVLIPRGGGIVQVADPFGNVGVTAQSSQMFKERITQSYYVGF